ncbi:MAG: hypothetical protein HY882_09825 [Deltaproteobacteria bacterium]|nr:hypothetical protein [Deltaproteobacteria bacterium]
MDDSSWKDGRKGIIFWKNHSPLFLIFTAVLLTSLTVGLITYWLQRDQKANFIPTNILSRIHQEKAKAQKDHEEFMKTRAGKIWGKHPYWDRETCQKIAEGRIWQGMSKDQAREALGLPAKVETEKREGLLYEEWTVDGRDKGKMI